MGLPGNDDALIIKRIKQLLPENYPDFFLPPLQVTRRVVYDKKSENKISISELSRIISFLISNFLWVIILVRLFCSISSVSPSKRINNFLSYGFSTH